MTRGEICADSVIWNDVMQPFDLPEYILPHESGFRRAAYKGERQQVYTVAPTIPAMKLISDIASGQPDEICAWKSIF